MKNQDKIVSVKNIRYGELLEVACLKEDKTRSFDIGYHSGMKVHYFNKKGVLIGNCYEFVPYEYLRFRRDSPVYPRYFMENKKIIELLLDVVFKAKCFLITFLLRNTYKD